MTRNYMRTWRLNRILASDHCECGSGPRVGYDKGCARCEGMDLRRYKAERLVDIVRRKLPRYDLVSPAEMAADCGAPTEQVAATLRHLVRLGEAETVGLSNATEYRLKQRRAA